MHDALKTVENCKFIIEGEHMVFNTIRKYLNYLRRSECVFFFFTFLAEKYVKRIWRALKTEYK